MRRVNKRSYPRLGGKATLSGEIPSAKGCSLGKEIIWATAWSLFALALTSLPYLFGFYLSSPEERFGGFVYNVEDCNSYIAKMEQGARGEWLFHISYTSEEHRGALLFIFHILLGKVALLLNLSSIATYHLARLLFGFLLLLAIYVFISYFVHFRALRRISFLLVCFSSGLGWLMVGLKIVPLLGDVPVDFWVPEAFTFLVIYAFPHLALAGVLMLSTFLLLMMAFDKGQIRFSFLAGIACFLLGLIVPFYIFIIYAVLGGYLLALFLRKGIPFFELKLSAIAVLIPVPVIIYNAYVFSSNPVFRIWAEQNIVLSPHPVHYLLGYGIVGPLAIGGVRYFLKRKEERGLFLVAWVLIVPPLLYAPFNLQRRLIEGFQIPLCILASFGISRYVLPAITRFRLVKALTRFERYTLPKLRRFIVTIIVLVTVPSNLLLLLGNSLEVAKCEPPIFHDVEELEAINWLKENTSHQDIVLSSYETGNLIPARSGNRVFLGHGSETIRLEEKRLIVEKFFKSETSDAYRVGVLKSYKISYVFFGPRERGLGDFEPRGKPYLSEVFSNGSCIIFKVAFLD